MEEAQNEVVDPTAEWEEPVLVKLPAKEATSGILSTYDGDSYS